MKPPIYFASGCAAPGELRGFDDLGHPVGVTVARLRKGGRWSNRNLNDAAWAELARLHVHVFFDSGAFCEVDRDTLEVVAPIEHEDWLDRLAQYRAAALMLGDRLHAVAPDQVANQEVTLQRLQTYRTQVRELVGFGAQILVAVQGGAAGPIDFFVSCLRVLGLGHQQVVPAFPMAKARGEPEALINFALAVQPRRLHLLGCRPSMVQDLIDAVLAVTPDCQISTDSCALAAGANGKQPVNYDWRKVTRRQGRLVAAATEAACELGESMWAEGPNECMLEHPGDWTDEIGEPSAWLTPALRKLVAERARLEGAERRAWMRDPDAWLQEDDRFLDPLIEAALNEAWCRHHWATTTQERKRRAVVKAFTHNEEGE
jgi:hypothetical protein